MLRTPGRPRTSIAALMVGVVGFALTFAIYRMAGTAIAMFGGVVLVVASALTDRVVRKLDRGLIASRTTVPTGWGRAIEVGLLIACGLYIFIFTFMIGMVVVVVGLWAIAGR